MATRFFEATRQRRLQSLPASLPQKRERRPQMMTEAYWGSLSTPETVKNLGFGKYAEMNGNEFTGGAQGQLVITDLNNGSRVSKVAHVVYSGVSK